jgi:hypothetical protein
MAVKNGAPAKTAVVFSLLEKLRGRSPHDIPTEAGVCFAGGFLPAPAGNNERVNTQFGLDRMQDVSFDLSTMPDLPPSTTLLQRADSPEVRQELKDADGLLVRKGSVDLHGLKAEEWLVEGRRPGDGRGHSFSLTANEMTSGPATPYLSLDLTTGGQAIIQGKLVKLDKASLTTGEAVGLWDAVSRTLRLRPEAM